MSLDSANLNECLADSDDEAETIDRFVEAWGTYFYGASVAGVPCTAGSLDSALDAMASALVGMSASGAFMAKLQAALVSFWGFLSSNATSIWILAPNVPGPVAPPAGVATLAASILTVFTTNSALTEPEDRATAIENIAAFLHSTAGLGGICTVTTPSPSSSPVPIL